MTTSSRLRCAFYAVIAAVALVATWSQNLAYLDAHPDSPATFLVDFATDLRVNPATRSFTVDLLLLFLAAAVFMVVQARRHGIRFVWAYLAGGLLIAISVTFPLFLIAREARLAEGPIRITRLDAALLAVLTLVVLGGTLWVNVL